MKMKIKFFMRDGEVTVATSYEGYLSLVTRWYNNEELRLGSARVNSTDILGFEVLEIEETTE
ncbi:hypothetical protein [Streptococcus sp.]|uniref:hypothetical protein n=1 Tax=Streptococcus sp. TaxID=1306 RepID=UPI0025849042|nr:hypothetical protein [Streptococcus sp.]